MSDFPGRINDRMRAILGREPNSDELEAGQQFGPEITAMNIMQQRQALGRSLATNRAPPGAPPSVVPVNNVPFDRSLPMPQASPIPGVSLSYNSMLPQMQPPVDAPLPPALPAAVPYTFPPPPAPTQAAEAAKIPEQSAVEKAAAELNKKDSELGKGLDDVARGISPKPNPAAAAEAAKISPMSQDPNPLMAAQAAQTLMAQLMQKRQNRLGTSLTSRPFL